MSTFVYDVLVSQSAPDTPVAREIAERLRRDGLRVWFDGWRISSGDDRPAKLEEGLQQARTLLLCLSANSLGADWTQLEGMTFRFRDPNHPERRFIPISLDESPKAEAFLQHEHVKWNGPDREAEYARLFEVCRPSVLTTKHSTTVGHKKPDTSTQFKTNRRILCWAFNPDGTQALLGSLSGQVELWNVQDRRREHIFSGHELAVYDVSWSADQRLAISSSSDGTVRLWDLKNRSSVHVFDDHVKLSAVWSVKWASDQRRAISSANDQTIRVWDTQSKRCVKSIERQGVASFLAPGAKDLILAAYYKKVVLVDFATGEVLREFDGHDAAIQSLAWSPDNRFAISASKDKTLRVWEIGTGRCSSVFEGHTRAITSVAWNPKHEFVLSAANDGTARLWDLASNRCTCVLFVGPAKKDVDEDGIVEGPAIAWSVDGSHAFVGDELGNMHSWDLSDMIAVARNEWTRPVKGRSTPRQVQYTNAKVLLVGESGAGKTGLTRRLALEEWQPSDSTVGAWATQWKIPVSSDDGVEREVWLWDFGGQADQRLIHQLYMEDSALAVLVFDGQKDDVIESLRQWDRDLSRASQREFAKLLVAGRVDAGGLRVSRDHVDAFAKERGYAALLETSAKTGTGCSELKDAILSSIRWDDIPWRTSPEVFKRLKEEILRLREEGRVLMRFNELRDSLHLRISGTGARFADDELKAVIGLLAGPGALWELKFGSWVLLQPERVSAYAQAVIQTLRDDRYERGCIPEDRVLSGDLKYSSAEARLPDGEERIVLLAMHHALVDRALCLRDHTETGTLLIFPSYYRRERPELAGHPAVHVSYRFRGFLDDIYATLVVHLHHVKTIQGDELWRYAADFRTLTGKQLGLKLTRLGDGDGELAVYFDPSIPVEGKILFAKYVHEHVMQKGQHVLRLRHYVCPHCGTEVGNRNVAMQRLTNWLETGPAQLDPKKRSTKATAAKDQPPTIICVECEKRFPLWDEVEQYFASSEAKQRVRELQEESEIQLDAESKERALVGEVISTVALAGQICREFSVSDHGIDMEIEFKNDRGEATGNRVYLQLKSGDSYTRKSKVDGSETFTIKKTRHVQYWRDQSFPVLLIIRASNGEVRWMEIRDYLRREAANGRPVVKSIRFAGERFDVMSVRRWRDEALARQPS